MLECEYYLYLSIVQGALQYLQVSQQVIQVCSRAQQQTLGVLNPAFQHTQLPHHFLSLQQLHLHLLPACAHLLQQTEREKGNRKYTLCK